MIQEKDFLYRVPVKTAPITTPGGQIRNPEILVDVEGGEFMHGNILDANSTNKLIKQSVDNKIIESGYVTKNLLDAETARATAKENQIKAQVDIINGDSTTEGSFRKAIADVVAAAPEDLDTLKEIADKLAGNDDLHTALNQAITEKADASALLNEVARATGVENNLKATLVNYALNSDVEEKLAQKADTTMLSEFIDKTSTEEQAINSPLHAKEYISVFHNTADESSGIKITNSGILAIDQLNENASPNKVFATDGSIADLSQYADATQLSNYVLTTALNQQVDTLNAAISAKQDAGSYIPYDANVQNLYQIDKALRISINNANVMVQPASLYFSEGTSSIDINSTGISLTDDGNRIHLGSNGVTLPDGDNNRVLTSNGSTINITEYATKSDLSSQLGPKADRSNLMALEQKITANTTAIEGKQDKGNYVTYNSKDDDGYYFDKFFTLNDGQLAVFDGTEYKTTITGVGISIVSPHANNKSIKINGDGVYIEYGDYSMIYDGHGINSLDRPGCVPITDGTLKPLSDFVLKEEGSEYVSYDQFSDQIDSVKAGLSRKQNKITVNSVDVTNLETADITQLRAIVKDLLTALNNSGLIISSSGVE